MSIDMEEWEEWKRHVSADQVLMRHRTGGGGDGEAPAQQAQQAQQQGRGKSKRQQRAQDDAGGEDDFGDENQGSMDGPVSWVAGRVWAIAWPRSCLPFGCPHLAGPLSSAAQ
jgi:hypothetical protein